MKRISSIVSVIVTVFGLAFTVPAHAAVNDSTLYTVRPSTPVGWRLLSEDSLGNTSPSNSRYVFGPGTPPIGNGGIQMTVTSAISDQIVTRPMFGLRINDLTKITYATNINALPAFPVVLQFTIDLTMTDNITDDNGRMVFDPIKQNIPVLTNQWQEWDAFNGVWWATAEAGPLATLCPEANPCNIATIGQAFPDIGLHPVHGATILKADRSPVNYTTYVDDLILGFNGDNIIFDFEPEVPCLAVCWVDAVNGNDDFGGNSQIAAKKSIQAAIDVVSTLGTVKVRPGIYDEVAKNRMLYNGSGPHTFGLFVPAAKTGIKIVGVDASNSVIASASSVTTTITTNATNAFGPSGVYVEADNVLISGLGFGGNNGSKNRTIEIVGNNVTLKDSQISDQNGRVYVNDPRYNPGSNTSHVRAFLFSGNDFINSASLEVANGAGLSGAVSERTILHNTFTMSGTMASIIVHGAEAGMPEFTYPAGGAVIYGNTFRNHTVGDGLQIMAHGAYDNGELNWRSYWYDNDFNRAVIGGPDLFDSVRAYSDTIAGVPLHNIRSINTSIQVQHDRAEDGDTLMASKGDYAEHLTLRKPLIIRGAGTAMCAKSRGNSESVIRYIDASRPLVDIQSDDVTLDGFVLQANDSSTPWILQALAAPGARYTRVRVLNNRFNGNPDRSPGGMLMQNQDDLLIECNYFNDLGGNGAVIEPASASDAGSHNLVFRNNDSFSTAGASLLTRGAGHSNVWVRDNRSVADKIMLGGVTEAIVTGNRFSGGADGGSQLILRGGNTHITVTQNIFTAMQNSAIVAFDDGSGLGANSYFTLTENTIGAVASTVTDGSAMIDLRDTLGSSRVQSNTIAFTGNTSQTVHGINLGGTLGVVRVQSNTLNGARADSTPVSPSAGVLLRGSLAPGAQISVTNNIIAGFVQGVRSEGLINGVNASINRNDLELNSDHAIFSAGSTLIDGNCNWYGNNRGPAGATNGPGTAVAGNVSVAPWLLSPDLSGNCKLPQLTIVQVITGTPRANTTAWQFSGPTGTLRLPATGGTMTLTVPSTGQHIVTQALPLGYVTTSSCSDGAVGTERIIVALDLTNITCTFTSRSAYPHLILLPLALTRR